MPRGAKSKTPTTPRRQARRSTGRSTKLGVSAKKTAGSVWAVTPKASSVAKKAGSTGSKSSPRVRTITAKAPSKSARTVTTKAVPARKAAARKGSLARQAKRPR
jgi:hypothetical protein